MPEMHLRQYILLVDHLQKNKEIIQKETGDSRYVYQNELDNVYFQHGMAYGDLKI